MSAPYTDGIRTWSNRYYADLNKPCGYYDLEGLSTLANVPDPDQLFALSDTQWAARMSGNTVLSKAVIGGNWVDYTPPPAPVPLKTQAQSALAIARQTVWDEYGCINEATPDNWVTYLKALMAIANGTDKTSTALPTRPKDVIE